jgi:hemoglobin/transferrin/lactoferrin receptor protein
MTKKALILFGLLNTIYIQSQTLKIVEEATLKPVSGLSIRNSSNNIRLTTNENGTADISLLTGVDSIFFANHPNFIPFIYSYEQLKKLNFKLTLTPYITFDNLVLSVTKWRQDNKHIPIKVSKITSKDRLIMNPQTAADLLAISGEVFVQKSQQGGGSPMIRGFSANRLLYAVDGVRMNTAIFRSGNIQNVISLDPFAIQNTEVLFGPGSIVYGSDAIGGVMSFQTLQPVFSTTKSLFIKGNSNVRHSTANDEKTMHFDINIGSKKWAFLSSFSSNQFGDLRMGAKNGPNDYLRKNYVERQDSVDRIIENDNPLIQRPTSYSQFNLMQKISYKKSEHWLFEYAFHYSETSTYSRYDRLIETQRNGLPVAAVWNYGPQKWMMNFFKVQSSKKTKWYDHFSFIAAYQFFEESRINRNYSGSNKLRLRTQTEKVNAYSSHLDFDKKIRKHQINYGLEFVLNHVISEGEAINISTLANIPTSSRYPNSEWNSNAAYISYQNQVKPRLLILGGLRFNTFGLFSDFTNNLPFYPYLNQKVKINNQRLNWSYGMVYNPSKKIKISGNISTAFRAPNVDDIGKIFDFGPNDLILPNPDLNAEKAFNMELNLSKTMGNYIKFDLGIFYTQLNDAMVRRAIQANGSDSILFDGQMRKTFSIQNAAKAEVYGGNLGIELKLPKGFSIESRFNYQRGKEEMDNGNISSSRHAAPAFGITKLNFKTNQLQMQLYLMYSAAVKHEQLNEEERQKPFIYTKDINGNLYSPEWFTLNYKMMYQFSPLFKISAGVENLLDKMYRPYSSGIVAPGRNFILSLNLSF